MPRAPIVLNTIRQARRICVASGCAWCRWPPEPAVFTKGFEHVTFDFLGYTFQPRRAKNRWAEYFVSFLPAISTKAAKAVRKTIREWRMAGSWSHVTVVEALPCPQERRVASLRDEQRSQDAHQNCLYARIRIASTIDRRARTLPWRRSRKSSAWAPPNRQPRERSVLRPRPGTFP